MFTRREPEEESGNGIGRDTFNEKPTKDLLFASQTSSNPLGSEAVVHTTLGDITIKLFPEECPKTVENFSTHSKNNYYNNMIFHRVIKGFMLQTGCPLGDGTGGTSIWGGLWYFLNRTLFFLITCFLCFRRRGFSGNFS